MCRFCKIHENTRVTTFGTSAWVWDLDLNINFQYKNKLKNFSSSQTLEFSQCFHKIHLSWKLNEWQTAALNQACVFFAGMHVPRCHVNTTLSNTIFSREYQIFACWLKIFFWIRVEKFMFSVRLVLEICGLKVVVSFNFAPSAPHVKRRIKSCDPRPLIMVTLRNKWDVCGI